jgi:hypothetical protein
VQGVYTLLLHADQSVRRIATGLVKLLDNFKNAQDLEPIQPLLQKVMHCLEYDQFDCAKPKAPLAAVGLKQDSLPVLLSSGGGKGGRQRVGLTREGIWLGLPTIMVIGVDWAVLSPQHWRKAFWSATQFL